MLPEPDGETTRGGRHRNSTEIYKDFPPFKYEKYEDSKSETESCVSMRINRYVYNRDSPENSFFPIDKKFFTDSEYSDRRKEVEEPPVNLSQKDLVHIIQILHGPAKKKQIKVEEVFEIENEKPARRRRMDPKKRSIDESYKENKFSSVSGIQTSKHPKKTQEKTPVTSKSHPNSHIHQEKRSKNDRNGSKSSADHLCHSQTEAQMSPAAIKKSRKSAEKIRPYMLDTKSRREIKDYEQYLNRRGSFDSRKNSPSGKVPPKITKPSFEVKFISSDFVRTSDLSLPESPQDSNETLKSTEVREKFQTEPKVKNTSFFKPRSQEQKAQSVDILEKEARERELYEFFEEYPKLISTNKKSSRDYSVFDKLKGDERDLPGIYSRFVRRSKGSSYKKSDVDDLSLESPEIYQHNELEDHIMGELINEKPLSNRLLELINKNPLKLEKKIKENVRNKRAPTKKEAVQDISLPAEENKEGKNTNKKKLKNSSTTKPLERKKSKDSQNQLPQIVKKTTNKKQIKKTLKSSQVLKDKSEPTLEKEQEQKNSPAILNNDPIKENLNMSPTTAITMMVLAADKVLAGKTEFFGRKKRSRSEIRE